MIVPIKLKETTQAAETLFQAFRDDKFMQWVFISQENYNKNAKAAFETWVRYGVRYGIAMRTQNFESIAIRRKPGDTTFSLWKMFRSGMLITPKLLGKEGMKRMDAFDKASIKIRNDYMRSKPFLYCWILGTLPIKQGQGFGRQLMKATFEMAERDDLACYLETVSDSNSSEVHTHIGYQLITAFSVPNCKTQMIAMIKSSK
ncbi:MAG: hypothetical protein P1U34_04925 [Coxiellaceae bacterium]|nr:hypothetical protein [Coxiellaceae bacterium]